MSQETDNSVVCSRCDGSGQNPSRVVRGRITTGSTSKNVCPDCGGTGRLHPVKTERKE